jgi:hypothetical protein
VIIEEMEFIVEEIQLGPLTLILSVLEKQGCTVFVTAKDEENRRIWKTPILGENGSMNVFSDVAGGVEEVKKKLGLSKSDQTLQK